MKQFLLSNCVVPATATKQFSLPNCVAGKELVFAVELCGQQRISFTSDFLQ